MNIITCAVLDKEDVEAIERDLLPLIGLAGVALIDGRTPETCLKAVTARDPQSRLPLERAYQVAETIWAQCRLQANTEYWNGLFAGGGGLVAPEAFNHTASLAAMRHRQAGNAAIIANLLRRAADQSQPVPERREPA